jgi:Transposase DDE domain
VVKADATRARAIPGAAVDRRALGPVQATRAVREYLEGIEAHGRPETMRKNISVTDPAAEWTCAPGGPAFFAYSTNYLVDVRVGVIVDVEATSAHRIKEVDATRTMIDRVENRFAIKPARLIGDMAYGAADLLAWMVNEKAIEPHVPVWDKTQRTDDTFSSSDFLWDEKHNEYRCPQGNRLRSEWRPFKTPRNHITKADTINYTARKTDCESCPMKARCCPNTPVRKITRSIHEPARDIARAVAKTRLYRQSRIDRKKVEMLFAHLKRIMKRTQETADKVAN